jgi:hypothetical protein
MDQAARQGDADDLHVVMGVGAKALSACDLIVIEYTKHPELYPVRIVITGKRKRLPTAQPAVVGVAPCICFMEDGIAHMLVVFILQIYASTPPFAINLA